jgi:hypothetical protein
MNKKDNKPARLVFSENGTSVWIVFGNDKESFSADTKEEGFEMVVACHAKGKITKEECENFFEQISSSMTLKSVVEEKYGFDLSGAQLIILPAGIVGGQKPAKITDPTFRLCDCGVGIPHGYIYDGENHKCSNIIVTKSGGLSCVDRLLNRGLIEESDTFGLNTLINLASIPESEMLN